MTPEEVRDQLRGKTSDDLHTLIKWIDGKARGIHQDGNGQVRTLSVEEQQELRDLLDLRDAAVRRLDEHRVVAETFDRAGGPGGNSVQSAFGGTLLPSRDAVHAVDVERMRPAAARSAALRLLESRGAHLSAEQGDRVTATIAAELSRENPNLDGEYVARRMVITESDEYREAFKRILSQAHPVLTAEEAAAVRAFEALESRALGEWTGTGGLGVPTLIDPTILLSSGAGAAPVLGIARVVPVTSNVWKPVSSGPVTFTFQTEGTAVTDASPTLAQPSITVHMARSFVPYSIEVSQDYPGFASEMAKLLDQGWTDLMATKTVTGSGSGEPFGVLTKLDATTTSEVLATTAGALGAVDIFNVYNALPERFRSRANWLMSVSVESQVRSFATTSTGQASSYFTTDLTADGLTRLNGRPVTITDSMTAWTSATSHQNRAIVGDFSNYVIAMRQGLTVEPVPLVFDTTTGFPKGQRGFFAWGRWGADVVVTNGLRLLNQT